ncbi:bifunctional metallophosphatase/5'-nucleotidase [Chengkuizengella axinellae]|uniref:Bifunctional UDP-sugar hydrolase/5'-nucleotidase n=1 Tax=Chengkuizengella axinellae TaxID=3064388 RepID=A0ABT9IZN2_9BACL|nr:bifunctional UDP-sugar hydrolase/5'-nucleotidase [Chengkuizengella sp. 2205SS18-9]MDP5274592.1 bifunctional UDP-sugar hydrolase/5'-nucleotidase [Chengkuizengella sp. 2205SS18-9]
MNEKQSVKKYTNVIVLGFILFAAMMFILIKTINFNDVLLKIGYYDQKISIVNTADIHGHIIYEEANGGYYSVDEVNYQMGMPLMKSIVDEIKESNPNHLFLDSGDMFHGTNEANINEGEGIVKIANLMGYDAMVAGNHDFNFGFERMIEIKNELQFPILTANVHKDGELVFDQYKVVEVGGKKIGLFGLIVPESKSNMNVIDSNGIMFEDPLIASERVIPLLKEEGVDAIILISHLGDEVDKELVQKVDGIDLVLSGHHHWLYQEAEKVKNSYVVEAGGYSTHVGHAEMYFKDGRVEKVAWEVLQTTDLSREDTQLAEVANVYYEIALEQGKEVVGESTVDLNGIRSQVRSTETNLANLITDAMKIEGDAEIALLNGGGIRESIPSGSINLYNIGKPLPFVNSLVTVEMKGEKIYEALERGLREWPNGSNNGGFLHVSGINYEFDGSKPAGERLVNVIKNGKPLDKNTLYKVATNDFLVNGGDDFEEFEDADLISRGKLLREVLADYIQKESRVSPQVEGRITILNQRYN